MPSRKQGLLFYGGIFGLALTARVIPLLTAELWRDEAVVGIMSLRVLAGEFPVFFFGQNFMGALEAYLSAVLILCFGPRAWVLELLPVILSLLFLYQLWRTGLNIFEEPVVRYALILLAIPPLFLLKWSHEARSHYPLTLVFGTLMVFIACRLIYENRAPLPRSWNFFFLGLVAGLGWWTNYLLVTFLLPVLFFLWIKDKKMIWQRPFLLLLAGFLAGSLPLHLYQFRHPGPGLGLLTLLSFPEPRGLIKDFFANVLPILWGFRPPLTSDAGKLIGYGLMLGLNGLALVYWLVRRRGAVGDLFRLRIGRTNGSELIFLILVVTVAVNLLTVFNRRLSDNDQKYFLPLYVGLPLFLAFFLKELKERWRPVAFLFLSLVVGFNLWGNLKQGGWAILDPPEYLEYRQKRKADTRLIRELADRGIRTLYADDHLANRLTFLSGEKIIASDFYQGIYSKYVQWVDGAEQAAYLFSVETPVFEQNLAAIGGGYRKIAMEEGSRLFTDFVPPGGGTHPLDRSRWQAASNGEPGQVGKAFDGDIMSRWQVPQTAGTYFLLDLGRLETVTKVVYWPGDYHNVPSGYQLEVSGDGKTWKVVTRVEAYNGPLFWSGPKPMIKIRRGRVEAVFAPTKARWIKLSLIRDKKEGFWSINELLAYGPSAAEDPGGPLPAAVPELVSFLKKQKITLLYADHWLSAAVKTASRGTIRTLTSNHFLGDNGENEPTPQIFPAMTFRPDTAFITDAGEAPPAGKFLEKAGLIYQQRNLPPWVIHYGFKSLARVPLPPQGWQVSANVNGAEAGRVLDGDLNTRWTTGKPQAPGQSFQLDLRKLQTISGMGLRMGESRRDYPRDLVLWFSRDGLTWQQAEAEWVSDLYWAGTRLFKMRGERLLYLFSPRALRYLKLVQEGGDNTHYWSIHEIELYGQDHDHGGLTPVAGMRVGPGGRAGLVNGRD